jgi:membrane-associated protease RseP (regulator of RpoE activity)
MNWGIYPAKLFKTRVEKFYLFFDIKFSLLKKKIGETEYGIGWLPLGGYVKISGMIDESMDKEQMALPAQPWSFALNRQAPDYYAWRRDGEFYPLCNLHWDGFLLWRFVPQKQ